MIRFGNKGQSLVLFILLIPIFLFVMVLVIDCGKVMVENRELDNVSKMVVRYGLLNIEEDDIDKKVINLFELNLKADVNVDVIDNEISIDASKYVHGVFSKIINIDTFKIEISYKGSIIDGKINIEKN